MYVVRLCKGLSYSGFINATYQNPLVELPTEEEAELAVSTGYFALVSTPDPSDAHPDNDDEDVDIRKMTKPQLEKCAEENGVDLTGCKNNEERVARILAAATPTPDTADDGKDYGENGSGQPPIEGSMEIKME